jgi:pre-mRNA-splicing factor ISY1
MGGKTRRSASIDAFSTFSATLFEGGKGRKGPRKTPERRTGGGGDQGEDRAHARGRNCSRGRNRSRDLPCCSQPLGKMARNEEKAQSMLNRFVQGKIDALRGPKEKRPYLASLCETLPEAERWRNQILGEVAKNVSMIQNTSLGEFKIRDMNDHINKLLREKRHWERRIVELGGPNYFAVSRRLVDESGAAKTGSGYLYFGAARELPGVKELLREEVPPPPKRTRFELWRSVDPDYYGYRDEDDGVLVAAEAQAEGKARLRVQATWDAVQQDKARELTSAGINAQEVMAAKDEDLGLAEVSKLGMEQSTEQSQSQSEIEKLILEHKKKEMLERYTSEAGATDLLAQYQSSELRAGASETREMLAQEPRA